MVSIRDDRICTSKKNGQMWDKSQRSLSLSSRVILKGCVKVFLQQS